MTCLRTMDQLGEATMLEAIPAACVMLLDADLPDDVEGGDNWAVIAKLIENCKLTSINPHTWLTATLTSLANGNPAPRSGMNMAALTCPENTAYRRCNPSGKSAAVLRLTHERRAALQIKPSPNSSPPCTRLWRHSPSICYQVKSDVRCPLSVTLCAVYPYGLATGGGQGRGGFQYADARDLESHSPKARKLPCLHPRLARPLRRQIALS